MNKIKIIMGYILSFFLVIILVGLSGIIILKATAFKKEYIKNVLEKNNYYKVLAEDTYEEMKSYMVSSGLSDEILVDLYTDDQIKEDVNTFVDSFYQKDVVINLNRVEDKLIENIDKYLDKYNIKIKDKESLDLFKQDIVGIYKNEVTLYGYVNSLINKYQQINNLLIIMQIILLITLIITIIILSILKIKNIPAILMASGLILLFIRCFVFNQIDVPYILIITENFSRVLRSVLNHIGLLMASTGIFLFIMGVLLNMFYIKRKNK